MSAVNITNEQTKGSLISRLFNNFAKEACGGCSYEQVFKNNGKFVVTDNEIKGPGEIFSDALKNSFPSIFGNETETSCLLPDYFNVKKLSQTEQIMRGEKRLVINEDTDLRSSAEQFADFFEIHVLKKVLPGVFSNQPK